MSSVSSSAIARPQLILMSLLTVAAANTLLILSAKVQVPFWPVPMTMQSMVVVLLAMSLGSRLATASILLYLAEGLMGLPVFAGTPERGIGLAYAMGPTGGYLAGFLVCTVLLGYAADRGLSQKLSHSIALIVGGHAILLACGAAWLSGFAGLNYAWTMGVVPFLFGTVVKSALGAALFQPTNWVHNKMRPAPEA